ncbi:MAG: glycerol-3-phosphate acyltransferase, partial [Candidatus Electrothrix sp. AX2]|nr:glycerol-3-phosphate acyltransferase [Candidatus Electrothrix gigas]
AAYMIGTKGRAQDGMLLGAIVTITHTFSVILLGLLAKILSHTVLLSIAVFIVTVVTTGFVSLGSLLASAVILPCLYFFAEPNWKFFLASFIVAMIWIKHHENIGRLLKGKEKSFR